VNITSTNLSKNHEILGEVMAATEQDIQTAYRRARDAQPAWIALSILDRNKAIQSFVDVCKENAEEIALAMAKEMGKPIKQSRG
jgi:acyl-CoA reductase-like NAD-dependent aldehyde dehydrogenase